MSWTQVVNTVVASPSSGVSSLTITNSPAASEGDILYAFVRCGFSVNTTGPSGWTKLTNASAGSGSGLNLELWRKVAGVGEPTTYQWTGGLGTLSLITLYQLTGGDTTTPEDVAATANASTGTPGTTYTALGVTTVTDGARILAGFTNNISGPNIDLSATNLNDDGQIDASGYPSHMAVGDTPLVSPPAATGDQAATGSGSHWGAILVAVRPIVPPPSLYTPTAAAAQPRVGSALQRFLSHRAWPWANDQAPDIGKPQDRELPPSRVPNSRVGPMVLRRMFNRQPPIQNPARAADTNQEFYARVQIPNPKVGPVALRRFYRWRNWLDTTILSVGTQAWTDVQTRFEMAVQAYDDIALRMRLAARGFIDIPLRFPLSVQAYKDISLRFELMAQAFKDVQLRFRLSVQAYKDIALRFELMARAYKDIQLRFNLGVQAYKDIQTRFRLKATGYKDIQLRFNLGVRAFKDIQTRFRLVAQGYKDVQLRFRLNATGYKDVQARFRLVAGTTAFKDIQARFRLMAQAYKDISFRFELMARAYKDVQKRFNLCVMAF